MLALRQARQQIYISRLLIATTQASYTQVQCISSRSDSPNASPEHASDALSNSSADATAAASAPDGIISSATNLIDGFHSVTGLPWWATLSLTAIGVRAVLFPLSIKQVQATTALQALRQQVDRQKPSTSNHSTATTSADNTKSLRAALAAAVKSKDIPNPLWIIAAPLAQIPLFITAVMSVRRMSLAQWPGFDTGGMLWFSDLGQVALDLSVMQAPMGAVGAALPAAVALSMFANINRSFGTPANSTAGNTVMVWVMAWVKLVLEWVTVPLFVIALQLPQGAVWYWLTSSLSAMAQGYLLQMSAARSWLGLPLPPQQHEFTKSVGAQHAQQQASVTTHHSQASQLPGPQAGSRQIDIDKLLSVPSDIKQVAARATDAHAMLLKAAALRAEGAIAASQHCLQRVLELQPDHPQGHLALGQNHAALKQWPLAEQAFLQAAHLHEDTYQQARCWFGTGIAQQMQGEHEAALQSLQAAQSRCSERLQTASTDETSSSSASDDKAVVWSPQQSSMAERRRSSSPEEGIPADPTRGLYVKTLLAKASIFRQLQRHTEADACMHEAKELDPAVGKYVKQ